MYITMEIEYTCICIHIFCKYKSKCKNFLVCKHISSLLIYVNAYIQRNVKQWNKTFFLAYMCVRVRDCLWELMASMSVCLWNFVSVCLSVYVCMCVHAVCICNISVVYILYIRVRNLLLVHSYWYRGKYNIIFATYSVKSGGLAGKLAHRTKCIAILRRSIYSEFKSFRI